jgi:lysophospholipase L1-like esterase
MNEDFAFYVFLIGPPLAGEVIFLFWLFRYSQTHHKVTGWKQILFYNLLSLVLLMGLAGLGGELYYRQIYDTTDSLAYTKVSQQWVERYCRYNAAGFRDNIEYGLERPEGRRRISFLGDSFTAGHGIKSVEERFPNLIRAQHPEWEIHVLARFGLDTGREAQLLHKAVTNGYQLDYVVLVYCLNDIADLFPEWDAALREVVSDSNRGGWLRQNSFFVDTLYHRYKAAHDPRLSQYYSFVRDGYRGDLWETQKQRLGALHDYVTGNGGRLLVVTFPFLQAEGPDYEYQFVHDQLNQFWQSRGVPHLDLQPTFAGKSSQTITVNSHDAHPNEYANRLAAEEINRFLTGHIQKAVAGRVAE